MRLYLDSSVIVKLYKQEKDSDLMDKIIQRVDKGEWRAFSSKWTLLEITRALKKDKKPKEIITLDIEDLKLHRIKFISLRDELIAIAEKLLSLNKDTMAHVENTIMTIELNAGIWALIRVSQPNSVIRRLSVVMRKKYIVKAITTAVATPDSPYGSASQEPAKTITPYNPFRQAIL